MHDEDVARGPRPHLKSVMLGVFSGASLPCWTQGMTARLYTSRHRQCSVLPQQGLWVTSQLRLEKRRKNDWQTMQQYWAESSIWFLKLLRQNDPYLSATTPYTLYTSQLSVNWIWTGVHQATFLTSSYNKTLQRTKTEHTIHQSSYYYCCCWCCLHNLHSKIPGPNPDMWYSEVMTLSRLLSVKVEFRASW